MRSPGGSLALNQEMLKRVALSLTFALALTSWASADAATCKVTSGIGLNLRKKANSTSTIHISAPSGATVTCDPNNIRKGPNGVSFMAASYGGFNGWMASKFLDPGGSSPNASPAKTTSTVDFTDGTCVIIPGPGLKAHSDPDFKATTVVGAAGKGEKIPCDHDRTANGLTLVNFNGRDAWMATRYLLVTDRGQEVPMPSGPPPKGLQQDAPLVDNGGAEGLKETGADTASDVDSTATDTAPPANDGGGTTPQAAVTPDPSAAGPEELAGVVAKVDANAGTINVRSGPGTNHSVVSKLPDGFLVVKTENDPDPHDNWSPVQWRDVNGALQSGWIRDDLIQTDDELEAASVDQKECDGSADCGGNNGSVPPKLPETMRECLVRRYMAKSIGRFEDKPQGSRCAWGVRSTLELAGIYDDSPEEVYGNWQMYGHVAGDGSTGDNYATHFGVGLKKIGFEIVPNATIQTAEPGDIIIYGGKKAGAKGCSGKGNYAGHTEIKIDDDTFLSDGDNSLPRSGMSADCRPLKAVYRFKECKNCKQDAINACTK